MSRIVLVHGSVIDGATAWSAQQPLSDRYELLVVDRPGARIEDPVSPTTYAEQSAWLAGRLRRDDHVVGHSAGAIVAMLAAAESAEPVASLCLLEPPAFAHAAADPDVAAMVDRLQAVWADVPQEPRDFLLAFFSALLGDEPPLPAPLPPLLDHGSRQLQLEQVPWEVDVPVDQLAARRIPTMLMTGGWSPAMDAVAASLTEALGARMQVLAGAGHDLQFAPGFNDHLSSFIESSIG